MQPFVICAVLIHRKIKVFLSFVFLFLVVAETYRFHRCIQEENENVSDYSARLRHYTSSCDFGQFLNRSLRYQFICGIEFVIQLLRKSY